MSLIFVILTHQGTHFSSTHIKQKNRLKFSESEQSSTDHGQDIFTKNCPKRKIKVCESNEQV